MAKFRVGGRRAGATPTATVGRSNAPYTDMTDQEAKDLIDEQDQMYNGTVAAAVKSYISGSNQSSPAANVDGKGHSISQTMNYLLDNGEDITKTPLATINSKYGLSIQPRWYAQMQYNAKYMSTGAHDIGKNTNLVRYAHDDMIKALGINNYEKYSDTQLTNMLKGKMLTSRSFMSTSYDAKKSPFAPNNALGGGREVVYNIKAHNQTKILFGAKAQAEVIIDKGTTFRVTGVKYDGSTAYPKSGGAKKRIVVDIEVV